MDVNQELRGLAPGKAGRLSGAFAPGKVGRLSGACAPGKVGRLSGAFAPAKKNQKEKSGGLHPRL
jgi:hypothetical protein